MHAFRILIPLAVLSACAPQSRGPISRVAQFADFPTDLYAAFEAACADPGERYVKLGATAEECRQFMPPEPTAYLILNYGGTIEDLPQSVVRLTAIPNQDGFQVEADLFMNVPQKEGGTVKVPVQSDTLDRKLSRLYRAAGGFPQ